MQQEVLPKSADPVLWSSDIKGKEEALDEYVSLIIKTCNL